MFRLGLLLWHARHYLYACGLAVCSCRLLAPLLSLLLVGLLQLLWPLPALPSGWTFPGSSLCYDGFLAVLCRYTSLGASANPYIIAVCMWVAINRWIAQYRALVWMA